MSSAPPLSVPLLTVLVTCLSWMAWAGELAREDFTFASSLDGTGPLYATVIYPSGAQKLPLIVVQHGYDGHRSNVVFSANRFAQKGFFCLCIDTRGNGGSKGAQDDGGVEIMDIYDGIQAAAGKYGDKLDTANASIVGYSNGGANAHFAVVRFPYLFRAAMSFFGIPDYGLWNKNGVTFRVTQSVGGTVSEVPDKYIARNSTLALGNLCGTRFHLAYDERDWTCPVAMQEAFIAAIRRRNYPDLVVHASKFGETNRWSHGYNEGHLSAAEDAFLEDIAQHKPVLLAMPPEGELVVLGFIVTPRFTCILGKGDDAAAKVTYRFTADTATFKFSPMTSDRKAKAVVTLPGKAGDNRSAGGTISSTIEFR
ncbi:MAG: prolyl oligopeptidase family serine peptidase [Lentisphaerae bacterium]|nr:prolyl oligopeptidase family serine peptidase [Lentisphaerota bacterium]